MRWLERWVLSMQGVVMLISIKQKGNMHGSLCGAPDPLFS